MMRVLVACDKFKGSLSALEAARAMAEGWGRSAEVRICPIADGGEGFAEAMLSQGGEWVETEAPDPLGRPVRARYGLRRDGKEVTAFLEMAEASGFWRVGSEERDPWRSSTFGTGRLLRHAVEVSGAERVVLGIGGSATNDGGAGLAEALGVRFFDAEGRSLRGAPEELERLERVDAAGRIALPEVVVACDVENPLCGPRGASAVFGPQKGATPEMVARLDGVLRRLAEKSGKGGLAELPGAGAAGGLGFGLMAFAGARLVSGFEVVAEALALKEQIRWADLVMTGEGSVDAQTLGGKGPAGVAAWARELGKPVVAVAGKVEREAEGLFDWTVDLASLGLPLSECLERAAELVAAQVRDHEGLLRSLARR